MVGTLLNGSWGKPGQAWRICSREQRSYFPFIETLESRLLASVQSDFAFYDVLAREKSYLDYSPGATIDLTVASGGTNKNYQYVVDHVFNMANGFDAYGLTSTNTGSMLLVRGTEATKDLPDVIADLDYRGIAKQQHDEAASAVNGWLSGQSGPVDFVGQSMGGELAQWFAVDAGNSKVNHVVTFNSPGLPASVANSSNIASTKVTHFINSGDVVSLAGERFIPGQWHLADQANSWFYNLYTNHMRPILYDVIGSTYVPKTAGAYDRFRSYSNVSELNNPLFNYYTDLDVALSYSPIFLLNPKAGLLTTRVGIEMFRKSIGVVGAILNTVNNAAANLAKWTANVVSSGWNAVQSAGSRIFNNIIIPISSKDFLFGKAKTTVLSPTEVDVDFSTDTNNNVMLVIDQSGSMDWDGKMDAAQAAAVSFVDLLNTHDKIGVVGFASSAAVVMALTENTDASVISQAKAAINSLSPTSATSIGAGLRAGDSQLDRFPNDTTRTIVLLTDGVENTSPYAQEVITSEVDEDVRIYTIGFGSDVDRNALKRIADQRHGRYYFAASQADLQAIYQEISSISQGATQNLTQSGTILASQILTYPVSVPGGTLRQLFRVDWPGSDLDIELIDPNGVTWTGATLASNPDFRRVAQGTYEFIEVSAPMAGNWSMKVKGVVVATGGENFTASAYATPLPLEAGPLPQLISFTSKDKLPAIVDADGDKVSIRMTGPGTALLTYVEDNLGRWTLKTLSLSESSSKTSLIITVTEAPGTPKDGTTIEAIDIGGNIKSITAPAVTLRDRLWIGGAIASVTLANCDGVEIDLGETAPAKSSMSLTLGSVTDSNLNAHGMNISKLSVVNWMNQDNIADKLAAATLGTLFARGIARSKHGPAVPGDFQADVTIAGSSNTKTSLTTVSVSGDLSDSDWNVTGDIGSFVVNGRAKASRIQSTGNFSKLSVGYLLDTDVLVGVLANMKAEVGNSLNSFTGGSNTKALLEKFIVTGERFAKGQTPAFVDKSNITAAKIKAMTLLNLKDSNSLRIWSLYQNKGPERILYKDLNNSKNSFVWTFGNASPSSQYSLINYVL